MITNFLTIVVILSVCASKAHTEENRFSLFPPILTPKASPNKDGAQILYDKNFISILGGAVDTVWQHVETHPGKQDVISSPLFAASDGSFYLASTRYGGFLTKINENGVIEWTIDRNFSGDTTVKYFTHFQDISESSNGNIVAYGSEGLVLQIFNFFTAIVPNRLVISSNGTVKDETNTRGQVATSIYDIGIYAPFSDTKIYVSYTPDSILFYSMDTALTAVQSKVAIDDKLKTDINRNYIGIIPYGSNSFIFCYQGRNINNMYDIIFLQFTKDFKLLNNFVYHANAQGSITVFNDGSFLVGTRGTNKRLVLTKIDNKGNMVWTKEPDILKGFSFDVLKINKSSKDGFIITGELYPQNIDGTVDTKSSFRIGFIGKLNNEGECLWYYTTGREIYRNTIQNFAEPANGDIITVCNSINIFQTTDTVTYMQITRLRPKASAVSEQPAESDGIHLFPNPTSTTFMLSGLEGVASVRVVNSLGEEVRKWSEGQGTREIDVSNLANGLYFVSIRTVTGAVVKPIIVSH